MTQDGKRISVVMATFNGGRFIAPQLESILGQTLPPDEVVIVDDGSTDGTLDVARRLVGRANVRIEVNATRLGPIGNFEKAMRLATGDLVFFADQDDEWLPEKIEVMAGHPGAPDFLYSDAEVIDEAGRTLFASELADYLGRAPETGRRPWYFVHGNCVSGHNLMVSRALVARLPPFPDFVMYDQWIALVAAAVSRVTYVDRKLCRHRIHSDNFCNRDLYLRLTQGAARPSKLSRKGRFLARQDKVRRFVDRLAADALPVPTLGRFQAHFARLDRLVFDFPLLFALLRDLDAHFPARSRLDRLDQAIKLCRGARGYWLPSFRL